MPADSYHKACNVTTPRGLAPFLLEIVDDVTPLLTEKETSATAIRIRYSLSDSIRRTRTR
jgi:hypothetical protein